MNHNEMKKIFSDVISQYVGEYREVNDGSPATGDFFEIESSEVDGISDNLATWWDEKYPDTELTEEEADNYFNEVYPLKKY